MPSPVDFLVAPTDSTDEDTIQLKYPIKDKPPYGEGDHNNPFDLKDPPGVKTDVQYNPESNDYTVTDMIGDEFYRDPEYMSFQDYLDQEFDKEEDEYWKQRAKAASLLEGRSVVPKIEVNNRLFDRIFGGSKVDIRPQGTIDLTFGGQFQNYHNPLYTERQRKTGGFDFDMNIQMNVIGKIGEKLKVTTNYNTQATFDFENQFKLEYTGFEDEIIQTIEAGNVSLPLKGSLIQGSQSLFGLKTSLQFGRLTVTSILTQQKGEAKEIEIEGGAQTSTFKIPIDDYDENRHFFLAHYFRDNYNRALQNLPIINSPINITRVEVWVTNFQGATQNTRDIVGFMDLGETNPDRILLDPNIINAGEDLPRNQANDLYTLVSSAAGARTNSTVISTLTSTSFPITLETPKNFEKTFARKLSPSEYTFNQQLGYVSLNQTLNPEDVLAVAFEYTTGAGQVYQVGEFSQDVPPGENNSNALFLKLLKSSSVNTRFPIWDLMMKNIYSLGAFQVSSEDFMLNVLYLDPGGGKRRYIPEGENVAGRPMIRLLNLDRLNSNNDPVPDGMFDFVSGVTILPSNGRVIFPLVEPFGSDLLAKFQPQDTANAKKKYIFQQLYDSTLVIAEMFPELNRYTLEGSYKSSVSSEISLGFNISPGSVVVQAGGKQLNEGTDYIID
jgi:cell surface protein SprA